MSDRRVRVYYSTGAPARSHKSCTDDFQAAFSNSPYHARIRRSLEIRRGCHTVCSYLGPYDTVDSAYCITFVPVQRWLQKMGAAGKLRVPTHRAQLISPSARVRRPRGMMAHMNPLAPPMRRRSAPGVSDEQAGPGSPDTPVNPGQRILRLTGASAWGFCSSPSELDPASLEGLAAPEPPPRKKYPSTPASPKKPSMPGSPRSSESGSPGPNKHSATASPMSRGGLFLQDASWMILDADPYSRTPGAKAPSGRSESAGAGALAAARRPPDPPARRPTDPQLSIQARIQQAKVLAEQAKVQAGSPVRADQAKVQDVQAVQAVQAVHVVQTKVVQRRAAELTIAVSVALRVARKLRAERSRHADASDQAVRDRDERMGALGVQLDEANARADNAEQLAQAQANSTNAAAAAEARGRREHRAAQREAHRRERAAERRRDEAELRCEALQTEAAMLRALLPMELQAQVPCTPPRDRSPKVLWAAATAQVAGSERRQSLFHARARAALALPSGLSQISLPKVDLGAISADHSSPTSPISPLISPVSSRAVSLPTVRGSEVSSEMKAKLDDLATDLGGSWRIVPPSPERPPTQAPSAPSAPSANVTLSPSSTLAPPSVPPRDPARPCHWQEVSSHPQPVRPSDLPPHLPPSQLAGRPAKGGDDPEPEEEEAEEVDKGDGGTPMLSDRSTSFARSTQMQWLMEQTSQIAELEEPSNGSAFGEEEGDESARRKDSKDGKGGDERLRSLYDGVTPPATGPGSGRRASRSASKASPLVSPLARSASLLSSRLFGRI